MPIVSSTASVARPPTFADLKVRVARAVGGERENPILAAAGEFLNEALIQFNSRLYECNKIGPTTLTATGGTATLPALFYKELECELVDSVTGGKARQLSYVDWAEYQHTWQISPASLGPPFYYTLFNTHLTGELKLLPEPGATDTSTLKITYYRRFPLMAGEDDILDAPQEIERALVLMAQADIIRIYRSSDSNLMMATRTLAEQAWARFNVSDTRHPDMKPRFRLAPLAINRYPFGDVFYVRG